MDPILLQKFRRQLATWIEERLARQRLPFQRLEIRPRILTERGRLRPDLLLWINRDSQLAGSMILLPDVVDDRVLADGTAIARALGLGHFAIWAARDVSIWALDGDAPRRQHSFDLPPASRVTPADFSQLLGDLLERLKIVSITSAPRPDGFTVHYFANLCLRNLKELAPGLTVSARVTAGETGADEWLAEAPRHKAWMSLWRILFLLRGNRLPPGLQPERLELAIGYALADLTGGRPGWLDIRESEPPLPQEDAVRLHHLASRLRQLGWPDDDEQAEELIDLLLREAGGVFGLPTPTLPWPTTRADLWVACQPPPGAQVSALIAPRAYLAGWSLKSAVRQSGLLAEDLRSLDATQESAGVVAVLNGRQPLDRQSRDARLIMLRRAWPSRRFDLPRETPAWLWDVLHLAGLAAAELSLELPGDWHCAPGTGALWPVLEEHYDLTGLAGCGGQGQALRLARRCGTPPPLTIHRPTGEMEVDGALLAGARPGTLQAWLTGSDDIFGLLQDGRLSPTGARPTPTEARARGLHLYLHTQLGRHLWELCGGQPLPSLDATEAAVCAAGTPVPNDTLLADLALLPIAAPPDAAGQENLEREFANIFGAVTLPVEAAEPLAPGARKSARRGSVPVEQIAARVFVDGIPRFPEHYLMHLLRPELVHYEFSGPLEIAGEFFDRISLRAAGSDKLIEVGGREIAEALVLVSRSGAHGVDLPADGRLLAELTQRYRTDLARLWDSLVRECRRHEPHRQAALKLARRIWQQQGLPPESAREN